MMLDANDPNFAARYPYGATVRDRWGRQLFGVISCNPETGEVVMCKGTWLTKQLLRVTGRGPMFGVAWHHGFRWVSPPGDILRRHGFWPAPLAIEAKRGKQTVGTDTPGPSLDAAAKIEQVYFAAAMAERRATHSPRE